MEINNALPGNSSSSNDNQTDAQPGSSSEDGRLKEWQDRGRVALPDDIAPDSHTTVERDFEPENLHTEKPKDNNAY